MVVDVVALVSVLMEQTEKNSVRIFYYRWIIKLG
jgi:hypothetical protein